MNETEHHPLSPLSVLTHVYGELQQQGAVVKTFDNQWVRWLGKHPAVGRESFFRYDAVVVETAPLEGLAVALGRITDSSIPQAFRWGLLAGNIYSGERAKTTPSGMWEYWTFGRGEESLQDVSLFHLKEALPHPGYPALGGVIISMNRNTGELFIGKVPLRRYLMTGLAYHQIPEGSENILKVIPPLYSPDVVGYSLSKIKEVLTPAMV